jgi:tetratricopeptide (TPR) repeat protein
VTPERSQLAPKVPVPVPDLRRSGTGTGTFGRARRSRGLGLALLAVIAAGALPAAQAQAPAAAETAPTLGELVELQRALASPGAEQRKQAFFALSSLAHDALPAIGRRLETLAHTSSRAARPVMSDLSSLARASAAAGDVDLAHGVLPLLARDRGTGAVLAAELVALLRALEAQRSLEAAELIVSKLFALDTQLFRDEAPRSRARLGVMMLPALIRHQNHPRPWLREFCRESLLALGADTPGRAVQHDDVALLAAILLAYGDSLNFEAMPVVVSYVNDERGEVQRAARAATLRFGRNAIWQLRERYLIATGKEADPAWSHERLLSELARWFDAPRREAQEKQLAAAREALARGAFAAAEQALDQAVQLDPFGALAARAAPLYARIAGQHEASDRLEQALACLRRAARLAPDAPGRAAWLARIAYLEAELRLGTGTVDLGGYRRALALDPALAEARAVLDELTGVNAERERARRRALAVLAAVLLTAAGFFTLRAGRGRATRPAEPDAPADA